MEKQDGLLAPKVTLEGETGLNGWYIGDITVTIEDKADVSTTEATTIKYEVTGANEITTQTITGTSTSFTITIDGVSEIIAWVEDDAGTSSNKTTEEASKDATIPNIDAFELASAPITTYWTTCSAELEYDGVTDATSGIAKKVVYYSESDTFDTYNTVTNTTSSSSGTIEATNVTTETTYYIKLEVTDNAGNSVTSDTISHDFQIIGAYVSYTPEKGTFTSEAQYSGYDDDLTFETEDTTWRIWAVDDDTLTLISTDAVNDGFYLSGYNGYNNLVLLLNNACKIMYSNSSLSAVARSINRDDIGEIPGNSYSYNNTTTSTITVSVSYPNVFALEQTGIVDGVQGTKYGLSEQDEYITGYSQASSSITISVSSYYYNIKNYVSDIYYALCTCQVGNVGSSSQSTGYYYLATRCTYTPYMYGFQCVLSGYVRYDELYRANGNEATRYSAIRPVVEIDLSKVTVGETGLGTSTNMYSIVAK